MYFAFDHLFPEHKYRTIVKIKKIKKFKPKDFPWYKGIQREMVSHKMTAAGVWPKVKQSFNFIWYNKLPDSS